MSSKQHRPGHVNVLPAFNVVGVQRCGTFVSRATRQLLSSSALVAAAAALGAALAPQSSAQTAWKGPGTDWGTGSNWSTGVVPNAAGTVVQFFDADPALNSKTITLPSTFALGDLQIGTAGGFSQFTLSGGTLSFDKGAGTATLQLGNNRAATINSAITTLSNLTVTNASTFGTTLTLGGAVDGGGKALTFDTSGGLSSAITAGGVISNTASVTKSGPGVLTLNGANTFAGTFSFAGGKIALGNNAAFGASAVTITAGGGQQFDLSSGSRTLTNQIAFGNSLTVDSTVSGRILTLNPGVSSTSTLTTNTVFDLRPNATLDLGANFNLAGSFSVTKNGFGTLVLEAPGNSFNGLLVQQGIVNTASFGTALTIGGAGSNTMLGTGDVRLSDATAVLNLNGTSAASVTFAGGTTLLGNGSTLNANNSMASIFSAGTVDFGTATPKGTLNLTGDISLGGTNFVNAGGLTLTAQKNLTFLASYASTGTFGGSGMNLALNSTAAQAISGTGAIGGLAGVTKSGTGTATIGAGITSLGMTSLSVTGGQLDLGTATTTASSGVTLGSGTISLHKANQFAAGTALTLVASTDGTVNLSGFDQGLGSLAGPATGKVTFNLGGAVGVSSTLNLGTVAAATTPGTIRIGGWEGTATTPLDHVLVAAPLSAAQLANVWFHGYTKGAVQVGSELRPVTVITSEWNGAAGDSLWGTGGNWVGGDAFNVPDHAGATAKFGTLVAPAGITAGLAGQTRTIGVLDAGASTGAVTIGTGGALVFDSGNPAVAAKVIQGAFLTSLTGSVAVILASNLDVTGGPARLILDGPVSGAKNLTVAAGSAVRLAAGNTGFSGDMFVSGSLVENGDNAFGTGTIHLLPGSLIGWDPATGSPAGKIIANKISIEGDFTTTAARYTYVGNVDLGNASASAVRKISFAQNPSPPLRSLTTFDTGFNFTGIGGLLLHGNGTLNTMEMLSPNSTFSGGLTVDQGTVFTTLSSTLTLGALDPGHNYFGAGNVTVTGANANLTVESAGLATTLAGSTLSLANVGKLNVLGGGAVTLSSGTFDGGTAASKGTLLVSGNLTFAGSAITNAPNVTFDASSNPAASPATTVFGVGAGANALGLGTVTKTGPGTTTLDSSLTQLGATTISASRGLLQLGRNDQIANTTTLTLNGGQFGANGFQDTLGQLRLTDNSALLLGNTGGLTFTSRATTAAQWVAGKTLTLQNGGQDWNPGVGSPATYVRFTSNPVFTAAQLNGITFTGYEAGTQVVANAFGTTGTWYILPSAPTTIEWSGGADPVNGGLPPGDNRWGTAANWLGGIVPNAIGASATVRDLDLNLAAKTIDVDTGYTIGRLNLESGGSQQYTLGGAGTLTFDGPAGQVQLKRANTNTVTFTAGATLNQTLNLIDTVPNTAGYLDWSGLVGGAGGIVKTGAGTLRVSNGTNTYSGGFQWRDPSLIQINADGNVFGTGTWTIGDGSIPGKLYTLEIRGANRTVNNPFTLAGDLRLQPDTTLGINDNPSVSRTLTLTGAGTLAAGMHAINLPQTGSPTVAQNLTLSNKLTGPGGLNLPGGNSGTLTLDGVGNDFTGGVVMAMGGASSALAFSHDNALGTGLVTWTSGILRATAGTAAAPLLLGNEFLFNGGSQQFQGNIKLNRVGVSTLNGANSFSTPTSTDLVIFDKDHVLAGGGSLRFSTTNTGNAGIIRLEGANIYSGGTIADARAGSPASNITIQIGVDQIKDGLGAIVSGAFGTGAVAWQRSTLAPYSDPGTGITSRRLSNAMTWGNASGFVMGFSTGGDATTLILDTPTIALDFARAGLVLTGRAANAVLSVESQLVNGAAPGGLGGLTLTGVGTLELKNGQNQIGDGIAVNGGTLLATATGDVTTGRFDAGKNHFGTGALILAAGTAMRIATADGSTVKLSGAGVTMNSSSTITVSGGPNIQTIFDSASSFTGTTQTGSITTSGPLIKQGAGTTTTVGARLVTPELVVQQGTLTFNAANLVSGVGKLTMAGGTLSTGGVNQTLAAAAPMTLSANSTLDFGAGASIFTSGTLTLTGNNLGPGGSILTIANWSGIAATGGGTDRLVVASGVSAGQFINNISFGGTFLTGALAVNNAFSQLELVPVGQAFEWTNGSGNNLWIGANWTQPGSPTAISDAALFGDLDPALNGKTITVGAGVTVGEIRFDSTAGQAFTIGNNATTMTMDTAVPGLPVRIAQSATANTSPTIAANLDLKDDLLITAMGTGTVTLSGALFGAGTGVTIDGSSTGHVALTSPDSNFTDGLTIVGGNVEFGASSTLGPIGSTQSGPAGSGVLTLQGGTVQASLPGGVTLNNNVVLDGSVTVTGPNPLVLAGNTAAGSGLTVQSATTITVADAAGSLTFGPNLPLAGTEALTKAGAGTLNFNSASPGYSGPVTIAAGTAGIGASSGFGTGAVTLVEGTTLRANAPGLVVANALTLQQTATPITDFVVVDTGASPGTLALSGTIGGAGALQKVGTGTLTLSAANSYSGGTQVTQGGLVLQAATAAGTGGLAVALGATASLAFSNGSFANVLSGAGAVNVSGANVTLAANNSAFIGALTVLTGGSANVATPSNLGGASVTLQTGGTLNVAPAAGGFAFANPLAGAGTLTMTMASAADAFGFGAGAANGFTGVARMGTGVFTFDANASAALAGATLQLDTGAFTQPTANRSVGNLSFTGGTLGTTLDATTGQVQATISTGNLDLTSGKVVLDLSPVNTAAMILRIDDGVTSQLVSASGTTTGVPGNLSVTDAVGNPIGLQNIMQSGVTVAKASYGTSLGGAGGLTMSYQLTLLDLQAGQTLALDSGTAAGTAAELIARVTGAGALSLASGTGAGQAITISNAGNDYAGSTTVTAGTAKAGVADVFKNTGAMIVNAGATLDLNGFVNQLNDLQGAGSVIASAALTANNAVDTLFSGPISGAGSLTKIGTGMLTLSAANSYAGGSAVNAGTLKLTNAGAIGSGAASIAAPGTLELAFSNAGFGNALSGAGTVAVPGTNVTITGGNTGLTGAALWAITGTAQVADPSVNLGAAKVDLAGTASGLTVQPAVAGTNVAFGNLLTGTGTLTARMAAAGDAFSFGVGAGTAFAGTFAMGLGQFALVGSNTAALANAALVRADAGSLITVGQAGVPADQTVKGFAFNGGTVLFDATVPAQLQANSMLRVMGTLDLIGGAVRISIPVPPGVPSVPTPGSTNLLSQDDGGALTKLATAGAITGSAGALVLQDTAGTPVSNGQIVPIANAGSTATAANGVYDYGLNLGTAGDGLYAAYTLREVRLITGQTLTLTPDVGASGVAIDLQAKVTNDPGNPVGAFSGTLQIDAGGGNTVSLSNNTNDYTGQTLVQSGTLLMAANNVLGKTNELLVKAGANVNANGKVQNVGKLTTEAGGAVAFGGGTLTVTDTQRAAGDAFGGLIAGNTLFGAGSFVIDPSIVGVNGAQPGYLGAVTVTGGLPATPSILGLNTAGTFDNASGVTLGGANDFVRFGSLQVLNPLWPAVPVPNGTDTAKYASGAAGAGQIQLRDGSDVNFAGNNSAFSGLFDIGAATTMRASLAMNLGTASIANAGALIIDTTTNWTLSNAMSGAGSFEKRGTGTLTIDRANAGMTGPSTISAGLLVLTDVQAVGSGGVAVNTPAADMAQGLTLALVAAGSFANQLSGAGVSHVTGPNQATIIGNNAATYSGQWEIAGTAAVAAGAANSQTNLGTGTVDLLAGGTLNAATTGAFTFDNRLIGSGTLNAANSGAAFAFASTAAVGTAFTGTAALSVNTFALLGDNTLALTNAILRLGVGNTTTVGAGSQAIGGLVFAGGTAVFDATVPAQQQANGIVTAGTLDVSGTGTVKITVPTPYTVLTPTPAGEVPLLQQDDVRDGTLLVSAATVTGTAGGLALVDQTGAAIGPTRNVAIEQGGTVVAVGSYGYGLGTGAAHDGLYVGFRLQQVDLQAGQSLVLTEEPGAVGAAADLSAQLTGTGNLVIAANNLVSLSNATNSFTGTTTVQGGILQAGAANVIASSSAVAVGAGATFDTNGFAQAVNNLTGLGTVNLPVSLLTLHNTTAAPSLFEGTIQGDGAVELAQGTQILSGANSYTGGTTVDAGATLQLGNGGTTGSIAGNVLDSGLLAFNRSDLVTFGGTISGTGAVSQIGTGTTVLTADNSYTGGTTITAGTLQLGNGGTTGSIVGNVLDNGLLAFNRSDVVTFGGTISGTGAVSQIGTGTTVLTADNSYTGGTTITAGTLQLGNGGITGSIVGNVLDNGLLAFNRSDVVTFGGTISGTGAVRQIGVGTTVLTADNSYTGGTTITAGVLQLGNGGTTGSIVGDVLDNGALVFNRSDLVTFGGTISGTGAVSQIGTGTTVLTANNSYTGGTTITAGTLQLGNGGITGSIVGNVLDNGLLAFNRSDVVTFAGTISGTGAVSQIGTGTTVLTADNGYTGGTTITAGTLQLGNGGTTGSIVGNVLDNGALVFNRSNLLAFAGAIWGTGSVQQVGSGTTVLTANNSYSGVTDVLNGTLAAGAAGTFSPNSAVTVAAGGTLDLRGFNQQVAGLGNAGMVVLGQPGGTPGTVLTVAGNYVGNGGTLRMNTVLGDSASPSDRLVIDGGTASGTSMLRIANVGGGGALTTGNGIQVVGAINGATTAAGAFTLATPLTAGPYEYLLFRSGPTDVQGWYLRSTLDCSLAPDLAACQGGGGGGGGGGSTVPNYRREMSLYAALPEMGLMYGRALVGTLHDRLGEQEQLRRRGDLAGGDGLLNGAWGRLMWQRGARHGDGQGIYGGAGPEFAYDMYAIQTGVDVYRQEHADGSRDHAGLYFAFGQMGADVNHVTTGPAGRNNLTGYSLGGYWTHYGESGWYLDAVLQSTWYDLNASSSRPGYSLKTTGWSLAASLESGVPFRFAGGWTVEPQLQLVYQTLSLSSTSDVSASIGWNTAQSLTGRLGLRVALDWTESDGEASPPRRSQVWARVNLWQEFLGATQMNVSSAAGPVPFTSSLAGPIGELQIGVSAQFSRTGTIYGSIGGQLGLDGRSAGFDGRLGVRFNW